MHSVFARFEMLPFEACNEEFVSFISQIEEQIAAPFPLGISNSPTRSQILFQATNGLVGKVYDFFEELFFQLGINNANVSISQMKVTNDALIKTARIVNSRRKE